MKFYVSTPIYYVNDRPHIGHVYTTTMADILARYHRLCGDDVFFLTGTDEHAAKVVDSAAERGLTAQQWADQNAQAFQETFAKLGIANDDFIRTSQPRHKEKVQQYVGELLKTGDVYLGEYEGWYDAGQEEYLPENKAKEYEYKSPFNGKPLVRKTEKNYFFKLSKYADALLQKMNDEPHFVQPDVRRNEVVNRIREGLNDVPISRMGGGDWGIKVPGDDQHTIYVWIDALINYLSTVDTPERSQYWPADVHLIAKDILWFHAVIWPAMLLALKRPLPKQVYAHSFWISEGQKMSKSLGNFVDLEKIDRHVAEFGLDAFRYYLAAYGPRAILLKAALMRSAGAFRIMEANTGTQVVADIAGTVEVVTIPELLSRSPHGRIDILKIDIEGAEVDLFKGGCDWLSSVDCLSIELHGDEAKREIPLTLLAAGFELSRHGSLTVAVRK
jgi:methionyl-tRNA synthetase